MADVDWFTNCDNVNDKALRLTDVLQDIFERFVPRRIRTAASSPPWFDKTLTNLKNNKNKAHRKWLSSGNSNAHDIFVSYKEQFDQYDKLCYERYLINTGSAIRNNPRHFYKFVNYKRNIKGLPTTMHYNGQYLDNSAEICDTFANFFESVYSNPVTFQDSNFDHINPNSINLCSIILSSNDLINELNTLNIHKGAGPDNIPPIFLRRTAEVISVPLLDIFNESLSSGVFPSSWRDSFLNAIFKNGDRSNIKNYRGIAILSSIPKLFEKLVTTKLYSELIPIINIHQHGFVKGRSTVTNLADYTSHILLNMERGNQTDAIYTDFSKAFDKVDHSLLLYKLHKLGMHGSLLNWIQSYLENRSQFVKINGNISRKIQVTSGVPQGSHLGPLLFIIFINDLSLLLFKCRYLFYADDLKLFFTVNNDEDATLLQSNLNILVKWCADNGMVLNVDKCSVMSFSRKKKIHVFDYSILNSNLVRLNITKDLGILLDSQLTYKHQIDRVCCKSKCMLGFVKRRANEFKDPYITKAIYCSLVRSLLEYCSVIWSPFYACDSKRLESVQKQFLIFALRDLGWNRDNFQLPPYSDRLKLINLCSLHRRRELSEALFAFDLYKRNINSDLLCSKISVNPNFRNLRVTKFLKITNHKSNYATHETFNRCAGTFNKYYDLFDEDISRETYKQRLLNRLTH